MHTFTWLDPDVIIYRRDHIVRTFPGEDSAPNTMAEMLIATYAFLADMPCPIPRCAGGRVHNSEARQIKYGAPAEEPCPNCGDFPYARLGRFARDWKDACIRVGTILAVRENIKESLESFWVEADKCYLKKIVEYLGANLDLLEG